MDEDRRSFVVRVLMASGLGSVAIALSSIAVRFVYPMRGLRRVRRVFLAPASDLSPRRGKLFGLPGGASALVLDTGSEIVALSEVCPHLGCKVHYSASDRRFVCPCHNGVFDLQGKALSGPPADEGKDLKRYAVSRVGDNLFIEIEETVSP
jgi:cytochrome b6-f complex iron-sulfur subunit